MSTLMQAEVAAADRNYETNTTADLTQTSAGRLRVETTDVSLMRMTDLSAARINVAALGDTNLVAGVASQMIRCHALRLSVAGAVIVQIKNGSTVLEVFNFVGNGDALVLDFRTRPYYTTTAGVSLVINLSAAVQVDGRVEYVVSA